MKPTNNQTSKNQVELKIHSSPSNIDLLFQEAYLAILPTAQIALPDEEFKQLVAFATEKFKEPITHEVQLQLTDRKFATLRASTLPL